VHIASKTVQHQMSVKHSSLKELGNKLVSGEALLKCGTGYRLHTTETSKQRTPASDYMEC